MPELERRGQLVCRAKISDNVNRYNVHVVFEHEEELGSAVWNGDVIVYTPIVKDESSNFVFHI